MIFIGAILSRGFSFRDLCPFRVICKYISTSILLYTSTKSICRNTYFRSQTTKVSFEMNEPILHPVNSLGFVL